MQRLCKHRWGGLFAVLLAALAIGAARADTIFVTILPGQISEHTTAGAVVNAALVMGSFEGDFRSRHIEDTPISRVIFNKYKHWHSSPAI